jgi:hypothetical protein
MRQGWGDPTPPDGLECIDEVGNAAGGDVSEGCLATILVWLLITGIGAGCISWMMLTMAALNEAESVPCNVTAYARRVGCSYQCQCTSCTPVSRFSNCRRRFISTCSTCRDAAKYTVTVTTPRCPGVNLVFFERHDICLKDAQLPSQLKQFSVGQAPVTECWIKSCDDGWWYTSKTAANSGDDGAIVPFAGAIGGIFSLFSLFYIGHFLSDWVRG